MTDDTVFTVLNFKLTAAFTWHRFIPDCEILGDPDNYGLIAHQIVLGNQ